jgi:hypothetical protein
VNPILRGDFVLSKILGTPTPPAPADAGILPDSSEVVGLTLPQVLEKHRRSISCKGCHSRIDPLGMPLQNYDHLGRWRETDFNEGVLADGRVIDSPEKLKKHVLKNTDNVLKNISAYLLGYAMDRKLEYYDYYIVNKCLVNLENNQYRFAAIVATIVSSYQFQHKY